MPNSKSPGSSTVAPNASGSGQRRVRVCYFNTWAGKLEGAEGYVARVPQLDLRPLVTNRDDAALLQKARLDCDWYAENTRLLAALHHAGIEFLPAWTTVPAGLPDLAKAPREPGAERLPVTMVHQPQSLGAIAGRVFALLGQAGVRHPFYSFYDASRVLPGFQEFASPSIAPLYA